MQGKEEAEPPKTAKASGPHLVTGSTYGAALRISLPASYTHTGHLLLNPGGTIATQPPGLCPGQVGTAWGQGSGSMQPRVEVELMRGEHMTRSERGECMERPEGG